MENLFKGVVYLTEEQYKELKTNGTITVGNISLTYDEDILYVTPDNISELVEYHNDLLNQHVLDISDLQLRVKTLESVSNNLTRANTYIILEEGE